YTLFINGANTGITGLGVDSDLSLNAGTLPVGVQEISVVASVSDACDDITLDIQPSIEIFAIPNPGEDAEVFVCSTYDQINLFAALSGSPDEGGIWTDENDVIVDNPFDISDLNVGLNIFTYTVDGGPCGTREAELRVNLVEQPDTSLNVSVLDVCEGQDIIVEISGSQVDVTYEIFIDGIASGFTGIGGVDPLIINMGELAAGNYSISVQASVAQGCDPVFLDAVIDLEVFPIPNPGDDASLQICNDQDAVNLFIALGPDAEAGGVWENVDGVGVVSAEGIFDASGIGAGIYTFTYTLDNGVCDPQLATVTVEITEQVDTSLAVNAEDICEGDDLVVTVAGSENGVNYELFIDGNTTNVTATGTGGDLNLVFTGLAVGADYQITVVASRPNCDELELDDQPSVSVTEQADPIADASGEICNDADPFNLFDFFPAGTSTTGVWENIDGVGSLDTATGDFDPSGVATGTYTFRYFIEADGSCADVEAELVLTISALPDENISVLASDICEDTPLIVTVEDAQEGVTYTLSLNGDVTAISGVGSGEDLILDAGIPDLGTETISILVTASNDCGDIELIDQPIIQVIESPDAGEDNQIFVCNICDPDASIDLFEQLGGTPNNGGEWFDANGDPVSATFNTSGLPEGDYVFTYVVSNPPCDPDEAVVTITIIDTPDETLEILANDVCEDAPLTVTIVDAQLDVTYTLFLDEINTGISATGQGNDLILDAGVLAVGNYEVSVVASTVCGECSNITLDQRVLVEVSAQPNAGVGAEISVCDTETEIDLFAALTDNPDEGGIWTDADGNEVGQVQIIANLSAGVNEFTYTILGGGCPDDDATVIVNVVPEPNEDVIFSLADDELCENESLSITIENAEQAVVYTVLIDGQEVGESPVGTGADLTFQVAVASLGLGTFDVQIVANIGNCAPVTLTQVGSVTITEGVNAGIDTEVDICNDEIEVNLFDLLEGNPDAGGIWTDNTGVEVDPVQQVANLSVGPNEFTYTVDGGGCDDAVATLTVNVTPLSDAGTSFSLSATEICENGSFDLTINSAESNVVYSIFLNGDLVITSAPGDGTDLTLTVDLSSFAVGSYDLSIEANIANCPAVILTDTETITINEAVSAGDDVTVAICDTDTEVDLNTLLSGDFTSGGVWTNELGDIVDAVQLIGDLNSGENRFNYTVSAGGCPDDEAEVIVNVVPQPSDQTTFSLSASELCDNETLTVTIQNAEPNVSYEVFIDGVSLAVSEFGTGADLEVAVDVSVLGVGVFPLEIVATIGTCDPVTLDQTESITINEGPNAGNNGLVEVCEDEDEVNLFDVLAGSPDTGGVWRDTNGTIVDAIQQIDDLNLGENIFTYTVSAAGCDDDEAVATINVLSSPDAAVTFSIQNDEDEFCANSTFDLTIINAQAGVSYTVFAGANELITSPLGANNDLDLSINLSGLDAGDYDLRVVAQNAACGEVELVQTIPIRVNELPNAGEDVTVEVCPDDDPVNLFDLLGDDAQTGGTWLNVDGVGSIDSDGIFDPVNVDFGTFTFTYTVQNTPCEPSVATVTVEIIPVNISVNAVLINAEVCLDEVNTISLTLEDIENAGTEPTVEWLIGSDVIGTGITLAGQDIAFDFEAGTSYQVRARIEAGNDASNCLEETIFETAELTLTIRDADDDECIVLECDIPEDADIDDILTLTINDQTDCDNPNGSIQIVDVQPNFTTIVISNNVGFSATLLPTDNLELNNLTAGTYTLVVSNSDFSDCSATFEFTIDSDFDQLPAPIIESEEVDLIFCLEDFLSGSELIDFEVSAPAGVVDASFRWRVILDGVENTYFEDNDEFFLFNIDDFEIFTGFPAPVANQEYIVLVDYEAEEGECGFSEAARFSFTFQDVEEIDEDDLVLSSEEICTTDDLVITLSNPQDDVDYSITFGELSFVGVVSNGDIVFNIEGLEVGTQEFTLVGSFDGECERELFVGSVEVTQGPFAGNDTEVDICDTDTEINLFDLLEGDPDAGGIWTDINENEIAPVQLVANLSVGLNEFTYTVDGGSCPDDNATLIVNIVPEPSEDTVFELNTAQLCDDDVLIITIINAEAGVVYDVVFDEEVLASSDPGTGSDLEIMVNTAILGLGDFTIGIVANIGTCEPVTLDQTAEISIGETPNAGDVEELSFCNDIGVLSFDDDFITQFLEADLGGVFTDADGDQITTLDLSSLAGEVVPLTYTVENNGCEASNNFDILISQSPDVSSLDIVIDGTVCADDDSFELLIDGLQANINYVITAIDPSGDEFEIFEGSFVSPGSPQVITITSTLSVGIYDLAVVASVEGCDDEERIFEELLEIEGIEIDIENASSTVCVNDLSDPSQFDLFEESGVSPSSGVWTATGFDINDGIVDISGLNEGQTVVFTYTISDDDACGGEVNFTLTNRCDLPEGEDCTLFPLVPGSLETTQVACNDPQSSGTVSFIVASSPFVGAVRAEAILRSSGEIVESDNVVAGETFSLDNLPPGNYILRLSQRDVFCNLTFTIRTIGDLTVEASDFEDAICFGEDETGAARITVTSGGSNPYFWRLNSGEPWNEFTSGNRVTGLPALGNYSVQIANTIDDECVSSVELIINSVAESPVFALISGGEASCDQNDGTIMISDISGGNGAPYSVFVAGQLVRDDVNFGETLEVSGQRPGTVVVEIRDSQGCSLVEETQVIFDGQVSFGVIENNPRCAQNGGFRPGSLTVIIDGEASPAPPYQIRWWLATDSVSTVGEQITSQSTFEITNLEPGSYNVEVSALAIGCPNRKFGFLINSNIVELAFEFENQNASCFGELGSVFITSLDQSGDANTVWQVRARGSESVIGSGSITGDIPSSGLELMDDLEPGDYTLVVRSTDANGECTQEKRRNFIIGQPNSELQTVTPIVTQSLPDRATGTILIPDVRGGTAPYFISAESQFVEGGNPAFELQWEEIRLDPRSLNYEVFIEGLFPGRYILFVADANGCEIEIEVNVPRDTDIFIPNIFTPNNDGFNDTFFIRNIPLGEDQRVRLEVKNRWGRTVFQSDDYRNNWDGGDNPDGVYFYNVRFPDGERKNGWVEIWR
ncbi:MAG: gliding motility-associated C-terminal domain-containing protein, partial [Cyclobacteriaceae bacterium]|nr:gliding motility-associated C-terminal domain-containing protein [Cyclobacteriaceae bacterium]